MFAVITCGRKKCIVTGHLENGDLLEPYFRGLPPAWYTVILIESIPEAGKTREVIESDYRFWNGQEISSRRK